MPNCTDGFHMTRSDALDTAEQLLHRVHELEYAIRKHRDQRGDDRCWMDDEDLYKLLPEGYKPPERDTTVELKNCQLFILNRRSPKTIYTSPQREIETLKENLMTAMVADTALRCSARLQEHMLRESLARFIEDGRFCRTADHKQGVCDCNEIAKFVRETKLETMLAELPKPGT